MTSEPVAEFQPPDGLRKIAHEAAIAAERCVHLGNDYTCLGCTADAVLAALFEACEVREEWGVRGVWPDRVVVDDWRGTREYAEECLKARREIRTEVHSFLIRRCVLKTPVEPVSSTGEEPTGG